MTYGYDPLCRLREVKYNGSIVAKYDYDELSRRKLLTLGNDANAVYTYDLGGRLTQLKNKFNSATTQTISYSSYDNAGNRKNMIINNDESQYKYDKLYQLVFVDYPAAWNIYDANYFYDSLGSRNGVKANGSTTSYLHNNLNQYTSVGGTNYSYNDNGNLTNDGTYKYYYDCENRLINVNDQNDSPVASYKYDYQGQRVSKTVGGTTTRYVYDGDQIVAEYENSSLARKFIYGPGIDEPICMIDVTDSNTVYYYHFDGSGPVVTLSNTSGGIVERYSYDVFGEPNRGGLARHSCACPPVAGRIIITSSR